MTNGKQPAFTGIVNEAYQEGLTKREYFAGLAMQAYVSNYCGGSEKDIEYCVKKSVKTADALLAELEKNNF